MQRSGLSEFLCCTGSRTAQKFYASRHARQAGVTDPPWTYASPKENSSLSRIFAAKCQLRQIFGRDWAPAAAPAQRGVFGPRNRDEGGACSVRRRESARA